MWVHGFFPGMEPSTAARRVEACKHLCERLRVSPKRIRHILEHPDRYWKRVTLCCNGKRRICFVPDPYLRYVQRMVYLFFRRDTKCGLLVGSWNNYPATAFWRGSSCVKNAQYHRHNRSSWCVDLHDAFASIRATDLGGFFLRLGIFTRDNLNIPPTDAAWICSRLLTFHGRLRQGAPVAPLLFNLMLRRLDEELARIVGAPLSIPQKYESRWIRSEAEPGEEFLPWASNYEWVRMTPKGPRYTRYGDDLCFSVANDTFPAQVKEHIRECVRRFGYHLARGKQREGRHGVMEFPGCVVVHGAVRPLRRYVRRFAEVLRQERLTPQQIQGHRGFLRQFRASVWRRSLRAESVPV